MNDIKLTEEAARRLADEIAAKGRDIDEFVSLAVLRELSRERYETEEIRKGMAEADAGDFASEEDVAAAFAKFRGDNAD